MADLERLKAEGTARIGAAGDLAALEALRVEYLGKQGAISALLKSLGAMPPDERQTEGPKIHALREGVQRALDERKRTLEAAALEEQLASLLGK